MDHFPSRTIWGFLSSLPLSLSYRVKPHVVTFSDDPRPTCTLKAIVVFRGEDAIYVGLIYLPHIISRRMGHYHGCKAYLIYPG